MVDSRFLCGSRADVPGGGSRSLGIVKKFAQVEKQLPLLNAKLFLK
jgi:hypothetical protein